jgi:hypothetical protein
MHYGAARPYKPRDKAKVESSVQLVQRSIGAALRRHPFYSVDEANQAPAPGPAEGPAVSQARWIAGSVFQPARRCGRYRRAIRHEPVAARPLEHRSPRCV